MQPDPGRLCHRHERIRHYALSAGSLPLFFVAVTLVGAAGGLGTVIQSRLMNVAGEARTRAASLMHSSFNIANASGPAIAAWTITQGFGWRSSSTVGTALAIAGLGTWMVTLNPDRKHQIPARV